MQYFQLSVFNQSEINITSTDLVISYRFIQYKLKLMLMN